jgi:hypothetical protein
MMNFSVDSVLFQLSKKIIRGCLSEQRSQNQKKSFLIIGVDRKDEIPQSKVAGK